MLPGHTVGAYHTYVYMQRTYLVHKCLQTQRDWRPSILVLNSRNGNVTLTFRSGSFSLTLQKTISCWLPPLNSLSPPLRPPNSWGNGGFSRALLCPLPQKLENGSLDQKAERSQDLIGEFIFHGSVSNWSDRGTGPLALLQGWGR